jgi:hypothetical protein
MRACLEWLPIFMTLLEQKWHAPNWDHERGELTRMSKEHGIHPHHLRHAVKHAKVGNLPHKTWKKLHNTDSWDTTSARKANKQAKLYQRDIGSIHHAIKKGHSLPTPIVAKMSDGSHHLVGGNTRLMAARAHKIKPKVTYLDLSKRYRARQKK